MGSAYQTGQDADPTSRTVSNKTIRCVVGSANKMISLILLHISTYLV